jgi:hypothetical protein
VVILYFPHCASRSGTSNPTFLKLNRTLMRESVLSLASKSKNGPNSVVEICPGLRVFFFLAPSYGVEILSAVTFGCII